MNNPLDILRPLSILQEQEPELVNGDYMLDNLQARWISY
jgi:hypothetical protein